MLIHPNRPVRFSLLMPVAMAGVLMSVLVAPHAVARHRNPPTQNRNQAPPDARTQELDRLYEEGRQALQNGSFSAAEQAFRTGWEKAKEMTDAVQIARFIHHLGNVYNRMGQFDRARDHYTRAYDLRVEIKAPAQEIAASLNNLGTVYDSLGQFDRALDYHIRALNLKVESNASSMSIDASLNNLGNVFLWLGQYERALDFHMRVYSRRVESNAPSRSVAASLNNLGNVYYRMGQFDRARDHYTRAYDLRVENKAPAYEIAASLNNLGSLCYDEEQFTMALDFFVRAYDLRVENNAPAQEIAASLNNLGYVYTALSRYEEARDYLTHALALLGKDGNHQDIAAVHTGLGDVYFRQGQLDKAEQHYGQVLDLYETHSREVGDPAELGQFQQTYGSLYARYAHLKYHQKHPPKALALLERGRARGLTRQIALNIAGVGSILSAEDRSLLQTRTQELTTTARLRRAARENLAEARFDEEKQRRRAYLKTCEERFAESERQWTLLRDRLFARYPRFKKISGEQPPTADQLLQLAHRHPDTLFLEWAVPDAKTLLLFALADKELQTFILPHKIKELRARINDWRSAIRSTSPDEPRQASELYTLLLGRLEKAGFLSRKSAARPPISNPQPSFSRLVLVADEPLLDVPFAALMDGKGQRLIERFALSSAVSLGILLWTPNERKPAVPLFCVADPIGKQGERLVSASRGGGFGPLPQAREEVKQIVRLFRGAVGLVGAKAREAAVKQQMVRGDILHFATHGYLDGHNVMRSGLVLAPEAKDAKEDGMLEAREIVGLPLAARLAVLSACETGRGQASGGEGLLGLTWAFRAAGCPSVVASQWKVEEVATRSLMEVFYRGVKAGKRLDEALRQAMLGVKRGKEAPYFWAGFQVIGETEGLRLGARIR